MAYYLLLRRQRLIPEYDDATFIVVICEISRISFVILSHVLMTCDHYEFPDSVLFLDHVWFENNAESLLNP